MAIIGMQRRIREVGRIRLGVQGETAAGRRYPKKIDRFRFTSADRTVIEAAAGLYGGKAAAWDNNGNRQYEVISEAAEIPIALPPNASDMGWSQFYESWAKGFCQRRCDGEWDTVRDAACDCDPEGRSCKPTSRLSVILPEIAGLGLWRVESHGYYAGVELAAAIELIEALAGAGAVIPARLRLDPREIRRLIDGKPEVRQFVVPVIDLDVSVTAIRAIGTGGMTPAANAVTAAPAPAVTPGWKPVGELAPAPAVSVEDQLAELDRAPAKPPRKNAAAPLKPTGRKPRTAAERAAADTPAEATNASADGSCSICEEPFGSEALVRNPGTGSRFVHKTCAEDMETPAGPVERANNRGADRPDEPTASQGQEDERGRGGTAGASEGAEPPPATSVPVRPTRPARPMTHNQHKKVMAMMAKAFPIDPTKMTGRQAEDYRRAIELGICAVLGAPGLTSRTEIDIDTAKVLLDALEAIERGEMAWVPESEHGPGRLVDADGQPVAFGDDES